MKAAFVSVGLLGAAVGFAGAILFVSLDKNPEKRIEWRPADRYEMAVAADGNVWRLDKATGTIHVVCGNAAFDVPEYRGYDDK